jgi:hypothetical protein
MKRYKAWCIKQASQTNCTPILWLLGGLVVMGFTIYHYRMMILHILEILGLGLGIAIVCSLVFGATVSMRRWHARRAAAMAMPVPVAVSSGPGKSLLSEPQDDVPAAFAGHAALLEDDNVVLRWTPDGKNLEAVKE